MVKTKQDLVNLLAQKNGLSRRKNVQFVNELVDIVNEALQNEKLVKISGLGTFKVIDTKDRESVNVQTGDRFVIEGRNKITFTPDAAMKELVNRPFSQFETVVLNDGVDFSDMVEEPIIEEQPIEPIIDAPIAPPAPEITPLISPDNIDTENNNETDNNIETENNNETTEDTTMEEEKSNVWKWLAALILCTAVGFAGGYYVGKKFAPMRFIPMEKTEMIQGEFVDSAMMDSVFAEDSLEKARDAKIKARVDSITRAHEARNESLRVAKLKKANETTAKLDAAIAAKQAAQQSTSSSAPAVALPKGDNSQTVNNAKAMVSNGAYSIVGTQETITVKPGQTMKKISKFYLGDGMECYIQAYNGISEVTEGQKLKIPKLQLKKKK